MSLISMVDLIKEAKFNIIIQNEEDYLKLVKCGKDLEHVLGVCSHLVFNTGTLSKDALSSMSKVITLLLHRAKENAIEYNALNVLQSLYYLLVVGLRKGLDTQSALTLANEIEILLYSCEEFILNHSDLLKQMHSSLWNISLQKGTLPNIAILLQSQALGFLGLVSDRFHDCCVYTCRVGKLAEYNKCSSENIENLYRKILKNLILTLKRKPKIKSSSIILVNQILINFGRTLYYSKKCNEFSKIFRPLIQALEPVTEENTILSMKMTVKIVEVGISLGLGQCNEDAFLKLLTGCAVISKSSSMANSILIDGLHQIYLLLQVNSLTFKASCSVFKCISERIKPAVNFTNESLVTVMDVYGTHLNHLVNCISASPDRKESLLVEAEKCSAPLSFLLEKINDLLKEIHVYNIGINCCNLGVIAYKSNNFVLASKLLDMGISYLQANCNACDENKQNNILSIITKKAVLLKDSLRYSGQYKEAVVKTFYLVASNILPHSDLLTTWIKCRRGAHVAKCSSFEKICLQDLYNEVQSSLSDKVVINIEELLIEELKELKQLNFNTIDGQIQCAKALMGSRDLSYSVEGYLAYTSIFWSHPEIVPEETSPMDLLNEALSKVEGFPEVETGIAKEYKARIAFWMYLCNLQIIHEKAELELEENLKENEPLSAQATDLGEEVQPNDACDVASYTTVNTFKFQEDTFHHLHQSLTYWEEIVKERCVSRASVACSDLLSIGYVYKLTGVLDASIKAFTFLLSVANQFELDEFWIRGVTELIDFIPELISTKVAHRLLELLQTDASSSNPKFSEYFRLSSLASVADLYLKKGQYSEGAMLISECMASSLMENRTPTATEMQIGVYHVASHYAFLPQSLRPINLTLPGNCLFLALHAARKSVGLVGVSADCNYGNVCWRHKVAWLHHRAVSWYGNLCYMTAQPRVARAYLRQALTIAEKFALPLRTAELLCTLSEVDLQCEQLEDCCVKIESVFSLLNAQNPVDVKDVLLDKERARLEKLEISNKMASIPEDQNASVSIYVDGDNLVDENMRDTNPDFELKEPSVLLGKQLLFIGPEKRIKELIKQNLPSSPVSGEFVGRNILSLEEFERKNDLSCFALSLHSVVIRANVSMGLVYAHREDVNDSRRCFIQAQKDLDRTLELESLLVTRLCSTLNLASTSELSFASETTEERSQFTKSKLSQAYLSLLYNRNESLCLEGTNWDVMESKALETMRQVDELDALVSVMNHPVIVQIILQCHAISKAVHDRENVITVSPTKTVPDTSPQDFTQIDSSAFKTPLKPPAGTKFNPFPSTSKTRPTPFRIFTDDSESSASSEEQKPKRGGRIRKEMKNLTSSFGKLNVDEKNPFCKLDFGASSKSPRFSPLSTFPKSPFSQVVDLPSRGSCATGITEKNKGEIILNSKSKLKKYVVMETSKKENPIKAENREDSPIINNNIKLSVGRPTRGSRITKDRLQLPQKNIRMNKQQQEPQKVGSESITVEAPSATTTRETRSRRNLKRL